MAKYRMTPKRKAALRKAQLASARKRRRGHHRRLAVAGGVTVVGVGVGAYLGRSYLRNIVGGGPKRPQPGKEIVHVPGLGRGGSSTAAERRRMGGTTGIVPFGNPGHEVSMAIHGKKIAARNRRNTLKRARQTLKKTFRQRTKYWREKPVPKVNRFTRQEEARRRKKK